MVLQGKFIIVVCFRCSNLIRKREVREVEKKETGNKTAKTEAKEMKRKKKEKKRKEHAIKSPIKMKKH
jgi:hypothetical protein